VAIDPTGDPDVVTALSHSRLSRPAETALTLRQAFREAPRFQAFLEAPATHPQEWYGDFLAHLAEHGSVAMAAMYARVGRATVYRFIDSDPVFGAELEAARQYFKDRMEWELVQSGRVTGNPVAWIVRNKAEQPAKYIERHAIVNLTVSADVSGDDAAQLLRDLMGSMSASTKHLLEHGALPQLPEATEP
jgi:hypothetical protein